MFYQCLWLFLTYSFLGWILETVLAALSRRQLVNCGVLTGPMCCNYGLFAVLITLLGRELHQSWFFLFIGCTDIGGFLEWSAGRFLERFSHKRWWDYSREKYHLDGYVSLRSAALTGLVGTLCLHFVNPLLLLAASLLPSAALHLLLWCAVAVLVLDGLWTYCTVLGLPQRLPQAEKVHNRLLVVTLRLTRWITRRTERRLRHSYPGFAGAAKARSAPTVFAQGCCFDKLLWLFVIGAFLGDITETLFCRATAGVWMSRSSVVWGPFSIVWGLAIALATLLLYNYRARSDGFLFLFGTVLGGVYEYACSVFTELCFGQVFWDYSAIPFNLGGRINLLYCFFWGIAAVIWLKKLYPLISGQIERIPIRIGKILTWVLALFMLANITVSTLALARSGARNQGKPAHNTVEQWLDDHYDDATMAKIYPNAISTHTAPLSTKMNNRLDAQ